MEPMDRMTRNPVIVAVIVLSLLAAPFMSSRAAFAQSASTDQYLDEVPAYQDGGNQQVPVVPGDPAHPGEVPAYQDGGNQQVPSGSPNAQASSESEEQATIAFLQAAIPILQGMVALAEAPQVAPSNAGYMVVGGGTPAPQQPVAVIDPLASFAPAEEIVVGGGIWQDQYPPASPFAPAASSEMIIGPIPESTLKEKFPQTLSKTLISSNPTVASTTSTPNTRNPMVDDPGDSDGDGATITDAHPGQFDTDPTDRDADGSTFRDQNETDPNEQ